MTQIIPDAEKARRYRRKLVDLVNKVTSFIENENGTTKWSMSAEKDNIRAQLMVEELHGADFREDSQPAYAIFDQQGVILNGSTHRTQSAVTEWADESRHPGGWAGLQERGCELCRVEVLRKL